ncbi:hypothetical protein Y032_0222g2643 [Ancylostoma ceylanicum]|nr:hypothetical protein Y032_0222g2643 [Ancylostoma ceylanicum]
MLADFDDACEKIGLQLNLTKTMFTRNDKICGSQRYACSHNKCAEEPALEPFIEEILGGATHLISLRHKEVEAGEVAAVVPGADPDQTLHLLDQLLESHEEDDHDPDEVQGNRVAVALRHRRRDPDRDAPCRVEGVARARAAPDLAVHVHDVAAGRQELRGPGGAGEGELSNLSKLKAKKCLQ